MPKPCRDYSLRLTEASGNANYTIAALSVLAQLPLPNVWLRMGGQFLKDVVESVRHGSPTYARCPLPINVSFERLRMAAARPATACLNVSSVNVSAIVCSLIDRHYVPASDRRTRQIQARSPGDRHPLRPCSGRTTSPGFTGGCRRATSGCVVSSWFIISGLGCVTMLVFYSAVLITSRQPVLNLFSANDLAPKRRHGGNSGS